MSLIKAILYSFSVLFIILTTSACANTKEIVTSEANSNIKFNYTGSNKSLAISGLICRYGRSSKSQLPMFTVQEIHQYVQQNSAQFTKQIKDIKQGMMGQRLDIAKLSVFYLLQQKNINFDYFVEGNQICANYQTAITLDFNQDFINFIELNAPHKYQFIADKTDSNSVLSKVSGVYPDLALADANKIISSQFLTEEKTLNAKQSILTFHYLKYQKDQIQNQSMVYVSGDKLLTKALIQYLQENDFTLAVSQKDAFWSFVITSPKNINEQGYVREFTVEYQNSNTSDSGKFINDSSVLPPLKTNTEKQKINLVKLYLEMIELAQQLRERQ